MERFNLSSVLVAASGRICGRYELTPPIRPCEDIFLPRQNRLLFVSATPCHHAAGATAPELLLQRKSVPSTHMRWRMTASRLATATVARRIPRRWATRTPQAFSHDHFLLWVSIDCAASYSIARSMVSPHLEMPPS